MMKDEQTIECTVKSCKFNDCQKQLCNLKQIIVTPVQGCNTKQPDESMCSSYKKSNKIEQEDNAIYENNDEKDDLF